MDTKLSPRGNRSIGPEELKKQIDWETRRVTAALGIERLESEGEDEEGLTFMAATDSLSLGLKLTRDRGELLLLWVGNPEGPEASCICFWPGNSSFPGEKSCSSHPQFPQYNAPLARAFYRLGFEDEDILERLDSPLTAHERLELRLSMPREFWPQRWKDEGVA